MHSERSKFFSEKETLEKVYAVLLENHRALQTAHDDAVAEKEEARVQLRQIQREAGSRRTEKPDGIIRAEIDRLMGELWVSPFRTYISNANAIIDKRARRTLHWLRQSWISKQISLQTSLARSKICKPKLTKLSN
jgi:protein HOOK3